MKERKFKVINGGNTYRIVTPEEAETIMQIEKSDMKVYAIYENKVEKLQLSCDVRLFQEEHEDVKFAIKVGGISDILLHMDE